MSSVVERFDRLVDKLPAFTPVEVVEVRRERTRPPGGFIGRPRCDIAIDLLGQLFQLLAGPALGGAQSGRVSFIPALLLAIGTHRFGVIRLPTIR